MRFLKDVKLRLTDSFENVDYISDYRPSNLPFCSVDQYMTLLRKNWNNSDISFYDALPAKAVQKFTWGGDLYTSIGTEVHAITQQHLSKQGILFGDYTCPKCNYTRIETTEHLCEWCKTPMIYEELGFDLGDNYIGGHTDGILMLDRTWLMDIKTTTTYKLKNYNGMAPYQYILQGSIYWNKLIEQRGIRCDGICFLMVPRNNVNAMEFITFTNTKVLKVMYKSITTQYNALIDSFKKGIFNDVKRFFPCKEKCLDQYTPCPYADWCWQDNYTETLTNIRKIGNVQCLS